MPTPRGKGLAGSADGGREGWEERIKERVNTAQRNIQARQGRRPRSEAYSVTLPLTYLALLKQAADLRNTTVSGYIRRAAGAFIAKDLGMDFAEVMKECPLPHKGHTRGIKRKVGTGNKGGFEVRITTDDGKGFGDWEVC